MLLRPRQKIFVDNCVAALKARGNTLGVAPTGCHAPGTLILMHDGSQKSVENIRIDDLLMGPDGTRRRVLEIHQGQDQMFDIRPIKGMPFRVNHGHILTLVRTNDGEDKFGRSRAGEIIDIPLRDYLAESSTFRHLHKLLRLSVDFPYRQKPALDPYFFGVLIGDGSIKHGIAVTTPDAEIVETLYAHADAMGLSIRCEQLVDNAANTYHLVGAGRGQANVLIDALRELSLHGKGAEEKFLPNGYRLGSRDTRLAVLAGLLDTDGHLSKQTGFEFSSKSPKLTEDVVFVARSLGFLATPSRKEVNGVLYWRVHISGDTDLIPTRVVRKQATPRRQRKNVLRTGFTVHAVGRGDYIGFSVDGDCRYLMGDFTVTHNSGKTIMLSAVAGELIRERAAEKTCVLAHRDELTAQNVTKFMRVNPAISTSIYDANSKSWRGRATFAMAPTLARSDNLTMMPPLDLLVIDEAHHAAADSYRRIIDNAKEKNQKVMLFGLTATPNRGDKKALRPVFDNVGDQIRLAELVQSGHLVPPRTFVVDVGVQDELSQVRKTAADFDMAEVAEIMDRPVVTSAVVSHWQEKAGDRKTVVFCSTVEHATNVTETFKRSGVEAVLVHGDMAHSDRRLTLARFQQGSARVIVNVAVLTEGWDYPPTSCVVLLRPSSYRSTMIQMIGRGLRTIDPKEHPGVIKTDCIVLDFGTSTLMHGSLEQDVNLDGKVHEGEAPTKTCPECDAIVPLSAHECALCGYEFVFGNAEAGAALGVDQLPLEDFSLTEIDLLKRSSFRWIDLFGDDAALMASGFTAWAAIFWLNGYWHAVGGHERTVQLLGTGERTVMMAVADDFLNEHETSESAHKTRRWLNEPASEKQLALLDEAARLDFSMTKYRASCLLNFRFNKGRIRQLVENAVGKTEAA